MGCNIEDKNDFDVSNQAGETLVSKVEAMALAQGELGSYCKDVGKWTDESKVTDAFPIYLEGYANPSYYECKIMTGDSPAGYILVNVDATDLLLVEAVDSGLTLTESYGQELKRANSDFKVYRYGYVRSLATEKTLDLTKKTSTQLLSQKGFSSDEEIELFSKNSLVKETTPFYTKKDLALLQEALFTTARATERPIWDEVSAYLFPVTKNWGGWSNGVSAWAIVLDHFQRHLGGPNIFTSTNYISIRNELSGYLHPKLSGFVSLSNMHNVVEFLGDKGYTGSVDHSVADLYTKFWKVKDSIAANKPVVMAINRHGSGEFDHYAVVQGCAKTRGRFVRYKVFFCNWSNDSTWIYASGDDGEDDGITGGTPKSVWDIWILSL